MTTTTKMPTMMTTTTAAMIDILHNITEMFAVNEQVIVIYMD